ncbi:MAG: protein-L-isoaspartate O-methyltransferase, partial [Pyrinomonadaceae bacterium]
AMNRRSHQPFIVGYMTEAAEVARGDRVLEIGTGSGYQAAVLAELAKEVYSIEIIPPLADSARNLLREMGYKNVQVKTGNGYLGWPEHAPFGAIIVTAAPDEVPQALVDQLAVGGKMIVPVGSGFQQMVIITRPSGVEGVRLYQSSNSTTNDTKGGPVVAAFVLTY